eukprot:gene9072-6365_t
MFSHPPPFRAADSHAQAKSQTQRVGQTYRGGAHPSPPRPSNIPDISAVEGLKTPCPKDIRPALPGPIAPSPASRATKKRKDLFCSICNYNEFKKKETKKKKGQVLLMSSQDCSFIQPFLSPFPSITLFEMEKRGKYIKKENNNFPVVATAKEKIKQNKNENENKKNKTSKTLIA